ncbi:Fur family transcriptional regulator [Leptolyngbya ohadii]|uniref:Fur family transcriptional regulator n=1 Tax=Leptolyngbya ohadii TaxID=1962290 RepID=UPI000B599BB2|nr:Fur family transcriptional regulator [Leptolyngbya ohadii]
MAPHLKSYEDCLAYCAQQGMRLSKQRQFILKLLWNTDEHLSARAIYDRLNQQNAKVGHTSVYQNLDALARAGAIERVERAEGCLYSHQTLPHSHVHCLEDGSLFDVVVALPSDLVTAIELQTGLKVIDYRIEFFAYREEK